MGEDVIVVIVGRGLIMMYDADGEVIHAADKWWEPASLRFRAGKL
jgi:hypothetical protein